MFRTADPSVDQRKTIYSLVLLLIAFCLVAHFLVEDVSLPRAADTSSQGCSPAGLACSEMEHQDDLVMAVGLPDSLPHNDPPAISAWSIPQERQSAFTIHIPPKIA